jgi:hypothetical protein
MIQQHKRPLEDIPQKRHLPKGGHLFWECPHPLQGHDSTLLKQIYLLEHAEQCLLTKLILQLCLNKADFSAGYHT